MSENEMLIILDLFEPGRAQKEIEKKAAERKKLNAARDKFISECENVKKDLLKQIDLLFNNI